MKKNSEKKEECKIHFTEHQILIIQMWAQYPKIKHIAEELELSEHTVQTHLKRLRRKLGVSRTFEVYRYLKEQELI